MSQAPGPGVAPPPAPRTRRALPIVNPDTHEIVNKSALDPTGSNGQDVEASKSDKDQGMRNEPSSLSISGSKESSEAQPIPECSQSLPTEQPQEAHEKKGQKADNIPDKPTSNADRDDDKSTLMESVPLVQEQISIQPPPEHQAHCSTQSGHPASSSLGGSQAEPSDGPAVGEGTPSDKDDTPVKGHTDNDATGQMEAHSLSNSETSEKISREFEDSENLSRHEPAIDVGGIGASGSSSTISNLETEPAETSEAKVLNAEPLGPPTRSYTDTERRVYDFPFLLETKPFYETIPDALKQSELRKGESVNISRNLVGLGKQTSRPRVISPAIPSVAMIPQRDRARMPYLPNRSLSRSMGPTDDPRGTKVVAPPPVEQLKRSDNAWSRKRELDDSRTLKVKLVRSILNKLTLEKFERLYEQIRSVGISDQETLEGIVSEIFEKALLEPSFSPMYAQLCFQLSKDTQAMLQEIKSERDFRQILLAKCREEFHTSAANDNIEEFKKNLVEEKGDLDEEEIADALRKAKRRMLGNIRFIGELFLKEKMISEKVIRSHCIESLLKLAADKKEEDVIESLCKLVSTVGRALSLRHGPIDDYFKSLARIGDDTSLSSRLRFMIQDVLDLKQNGWQPRVKAAEAKKISEIHADMQKEETRKAQAAVSMDSRSNLRRPDFRGRSSPAPNMVMSEAKPYVSKSRVDAIFDRQLKDRDGSSLISSRTNDVRLGPVSSWEKRQGIDSGDFRVSSSSSTVDRGHARDGVVEPVRSSQQVEELDPRKAERKSQGILEDYEYTSSLDGAIESIKDFPASKKRFVISCLGFGAEAKPTMHARIAEVFLKAGQLGIISRTDFSEAFEEFVKSLENYDSPLKADFVGNCLGQIAGWGFIDDSDASKGLALLSTAMGGIDEPNLCMKLVINTLVGLRHAIGERSPDVDREACVLDVFRAAHFDAVFGANLEERTSNLEKLIKGKDLEFLLTLGLPSESESAS